jgi:DinB superfamily
MGFSFSHSLFSYRLSNSLGVRLQKLIIVTMENKLSDIIQEITPKLLALSDSEASQPRTAGKWSPKEILGHLIDSACNNHRRMVKMQIQSGLSFDGYEQDAWVSLQSYQQRSWIDIVNLWQAYNLHLGHVITQISPEALANTGLFGEQIVTLEFLANDYIAHLEHHLAQIL